LEPKRKAEAEAIAAASAAVTEESDERHCEQEPESEPALPVAGSDEDEIASLVEGAGRLIGHSEVEIEALRSANKKLTQDKRALQQRIETLEARVVELEAKGTGDPMSASEFQAAIKKWEDTVETQKTIIRDLQNENATLRAGVAVQPEKTADIARRSAERETS
jgi:uncharacterized protein YukE